MATIDEILDKPRENASGTPATKGEPSAPATVMTESQQTEQPQTLSYEDLIERFMPKPKTQEELAKDKKKYKRKQIFNAISEGLSALSNLYFTTQGAPNMYKAKDNSIDRTRVNYERMMSENKSNALAYLNARMAARQADDSKADSERRWQRLIGLDQYQRERDKIADQRYQNEFNYKMGRDKVADQHYEDEQEYRRKRDKTADDQWQKTFNLREQQHNDDVETERGRNAATAARGVRGKRIGFADGDGNQVGIYENVWKGSMQQVFDVMAEEGIGKPENLSERTYKLKLSKMTQKEKEDYVKQNWHKSPKASQIMLTLSKLDPATMTSELNDEVVEYDPNDEVIDYVPGNK